MMWRTNSSRPWNGRWAWKHALLVLLIVLFSGRITVSVIYAEDDYSNAYYQRDRLNEGLSQVGPPPNLQIPQSTLEYFVTTAGNGEFQRAVMALNLNLIPEAQQAQHGPKLAKHLHYLLVQKSLIDWERVPDRPDGRMTDPSLDNKSPLAGEPRRSLKLGTIALDGHDSVVRLQRVKVPDAPAVWVFSPQTIDNVPRLYEAFGPTALDQRMPAWAKGPTNLLRSPSTAWMSPTTGCCKPFSPWKPGMMTAFCVSIGMKSSGLWDRRPACGCWMGVMGRRKEPSRWGSNANIAGGERGRMPAPSMGGNG